MCGLKYFVPETAGVGNHNGCVNRPTPGCDGLATSAKVGSALEPTFYLGYNKWASTAGSPAVGSTRAGSPCGSMGDRPEGALRVLAARTGLGQDVGFSDRHNLCLCSRHFIRPEPRC